jgi:acetyl esterase/lipase
VGGIYQAAFTDDRDVQRDASPALKPIKDPPPYLILHVAGRADSKAQSELLAAALRKAGGQATVQAIAGKNHLTIHRDCGKDGDPVTVAIARFLGLAAELPAGPG